MYIFYCCFITIVVLYIRSEHLNAYLPIKTNGTHQLLVYADDANLLGDNIDTVKKSTQTLIDASKEVGLEVNAEKIKYLLLPRQHNARQNQDR
jgi:hypothetical protein